MSVVDLRYTKPSTTRTSSVIQIHRSQRAIAFHRRALSKWGQAPGVRAAEREIVRRVTLSLWLMVAVVVVVLILFLAEVLAGWNW